MLFQILNWLHSAQSAVLVNKRAETLASSCYIVKYWVLICCCSPDVINTQRDMDTQRDIHGRREVILLLIHSHDTKRESLHQ